MKPDSDRIRLALEYGEITVAELAEMTKISRQTLYKWLRPEAVVKSESMLHLVYSAIKKIEKAVDRGDLPLPKTVPNEARTVELWKAISKS